MPSSFMVKRNYAHCPLKKRPLALYNEPASTAEQDEPEDLSVKRPRLSSSPPPPEVRPVQLTNLSERVTAFNAVEFSHPQNVGTYPCEYPVISRPIQETHYEVLSPPVSQNYYYNHSNVIVNPTPIKLEPNIVSSSSYRPPPHTTSRSQENLPSLAEYYLQLFKATSEAENKPVPSSNMPWQSSSYFPPSPQSSPVSHNTLSQSFSPRPSPVSPQFYSPPMPSYPESSALISPVSTCSSTTSDSEDETSSVHSHPRSLTSRTTRYSCDSCGKSYSTQSGLRKHNELHCSSLGPRAFSCKHCAKAYTSIGALKMHIRTHTLPCKCHVCGKAFSRPWLLQGHIRTHTGEKPFECQQCHRSFADRSNLRAHQQTHERVKKYACHTCKKTFSRMSLLNKHSENACMGVKFSSSLPAAESPYSPTQSST